MTDLRRLAERLDAEAHETDLLHEGIGQLFAAANEKLGANIAPTKGQSSAAMLMREAAIALRGIRESS